MNTLSQTCIALCCSSALFLTGCQHFTQPQLPKSTQESENQFNLQGKIGVRTPQQSGSAFFTWAQQQQNFDIELTGILGMGKTQIQGKNGKVTLNSAKTGLITASSPEELLERATGWQAPITHIISWVQARPATTQAQTTQDSNARINHIQEDGWNVDLSYDAEQKLPNKLILKQTLEDNKENRITMVIQNR
ncbi:MULTISPECIES: lipoprotein insertase outer membrane protein LolB [Acinetobacter]|uniref:Outer-membrane lipoprotein LolB n=1 Tax=Acinetobacter ursingii TaxID=108980 RepID=A0A7T9UIK9_9GAMM|nr:MULTISPECIES: lipoprotein insertase outer membrane protein LolB [Acinetobacter]ECE6725509.1 outer membrane lipoprotein LolB [Salmonella enterica subsp. enterica serovar Paratyphi A]ENX49191.1 outer membrane lipoprotein LolB [Acinetobacter ursingii NIPH 706]EXD36624.1 outer membrane lipoprotein LolB [Acinetobacter sp. 479375]MCH2015559.1 lipoprotein insertase outer membrane protein LolB [Acinetobacter ursingii]MCU4589700.1 lipoprotein insertase outer membrane protein LolB [Acinetobacter ursi